MPKSFPYKVRFKAIDNISRVVDKIQNKFPKLTKKINRTNNAFQILQNKTKKIRASFNKMGQSMTNLGKKLTIGITAPVVGFATLAVKKFGDFEQGLIGVGKTTGIAGKDLNFLGKEIENLTKEIPRSATELLELAQAAGQLGIKGSDNILKFTSVMAKLETASDVAGEEGAKSIARILQVTGDGVGNVDRFSAALVDLGNNAAASESEILGVANRIAGNIARFDAGSAGVLGIATALKSLGKQAESSGSVVGRAFDAIDQNIRGGGKGLAALSKVTGIAADEIEQRFKTDSVGVFKAFIDGLAKMQKQGKNTTKILGAFGLKGVRINDILGTLIKRNEVLAVNLERSGKAWKENTALQKEFEVATKSFNNSMKFLSNEFFIAARRLGKELAPAIVKVALLFRKFFGFLEKNPAFAKFLAISAAVLAILGPLTLGFGALFLIFPKLILAWEASTAVLAGFGLTLKGVMLSMASFAAVAALIGLAAFMIIKNWEPIKQFFDDLWSDPLTQAKEFFGFVLDMARKAGSFFTFGKGLTDSEQTDQNLLKKGFKISGPGGEALGSKKVTEKSNVEFKERTNNARVDVTFKNTPPGTKVVSEGQGGLLGINNGMAGAF